MWGRQTQQKLDHLMRQLKEDKFKYTPKEDKEIDWGRYDKAQINEINDMLLIIRDVVEKASSRLDIEKKLNT
ncbi:MAG: hypothetical protein KKB85_03605, partial [Candidatus Altiarchaeota archaeon]|nr:hypothetical protein [Candidatus Altiarchaeota archaeon]